MEPDSTPAEDAARAARRRKLAQLSEIRKKLSPEQVAALREVFVEIIDAHQDKILKRLRRRGLTGDAAEDVLQEVFLALYSWIVANGWPRSVPRMLHVMMKRRFADRVRALVDERMFVGIPSSRSEQPGSQPDVERAIDLRELARRYVRRLPLEQRAVAENILLKDLSHEATAAALGGISLRAVKSRLKAAEAALRAFATPFLPPSERAS